MFRGTPCIFVFNLQKNDDFHPHCSELRLKVYSRATYNYTCTVLLVVTLVFLLCTTCIVSQWIDVRIKTCYNIFQGFYCIKPLSNLPFKHTKLFTIPPGPLLPSILPSLLPLNCNYIPPGPLLPSLLPSNCNYMKYQHSGIKPSPIKQTLLVNVFSAFSIKSGK